MSSSPSVAVAKHLEQPGASPSFSRLWASGKSPLPLCLLLIVVVLVSYNSVIHNGFLNYDDDGYITNNLHVKTGLTWATAKWAFSTYYLANWAPLSWLSHALDCELFGLNPAGHHYISVLLHAGNAVLLFLLLYRVTAFRWRSLTVAALFALHPVNVESVAWAAERKNVLSMLFLLLAFHAYVWYTRKPALVSYLAVLFLFSLGLLSKSQVITFPFLLWLWDYWPLGRIFPPSASHTHLPDGQTRLRNGRVVWEKVPLLLLSAASALITMKAEKAGGALKTQYSLLLRLETATISYARYLGKAVWPSKLVALYPHPTELYPAWQVAAAAALLILITALVILARNRRYLAVGWFWFLGSMVPMIGLVQVGAHSIADRFAYLPFIGLFLMLTWLLADGAQAVRIPAPCLALPAACCFLVLGALTYRQVSYWHDIPSFWLRTLALTENNYVAHDTWGNFLASQGHTEDAAAQFRAALAIRPDDLPANLNLGAYEHSRGHLPAAIARYEIVAQYAADLDLRATAYGNLGSAYREAGDWIKAQRFYEMSLQLEPHRPMAMVGLGLVAQKNGDLADAVRQFSNAMAVEPTDVGFLLLAQALQHQGHLDQAKTIYERVARLSPNLPEAQKTAASLLSGK
jgi:tetratricopeptide (TPR) repeat protein